MTKSVQYIPIWADICTFVGDKVGYKRALAVSVEHS